VKPARLHAPGFDLKLTLESGQVFNWHTHDDGFVGLIADRPARIEQRDDWLFIEGVTPETVVHHFALDHPMAEILDSFPEDEAMRAATAACPGLRIMRQPMWECLGTFITSSMKQVPHIRKMSAAVRELWGVGVDSPWRPLFSYPTPDKLASASEADLRACGLGFRAPNLLGTARMISEGSVKLDQLASLSDDEARAELCKLPGVGEKVANCVLLFSCERMAAVPIDVWIGRVLREKYFVRKRKVTASRLRDFADSYFGPYAGYAQQFLFHHARTTARKKCRDNVRINTSPLPHVH